MEYTPLIISMVLLFVFLLSGLWIAFGLGILTLFMYVVLMGKSAAAFTYSTYNAIDSFSLLAVPLYIFMGEILLRGQITGKLYDGLGPLFSHVPGKLLHANVAACAMFATVNGSSVATTMAVANVAVPELLKRGYNKEISYGSLAAAGPLGTLIPPSLSYITYAVLAGVSAGKLFVGGIIPGIVQALCLMGVILVQVIRRPNLVPPEPKASARAILMGLPGLLPIIVLMLTVIGVIYFGIATATEAAAYGVVGAIVISLLFGRLTAVAVYGAAIRALRVSAVVVLLLMIAIAFGNALAYLGVVDQLSNLILSLPGSPMLKIWGIWLMYFIMGMFLDGASMKALTISWIVPGIISLGYDPIWFGVVQTVMSELACVTPPVGLTLFAIQAQTREKFSVVTRGAVPFVGGLVGSLALLTFFPQLVLWLPERMF